MRNKFLTCTMCMSVLSLLFSCSIDNDFDLSKDIDMTVAVGNGISIPLGSTSEIYLTEMIDPEKSDIIEVDDNGYYTIRKSGTIDRTTVRVDETTIEVNPTSYEEIYETQVVDINYDDLDRYPESVRNEILANTTYTHVMEEKIDRNNVEYKIEQNDIPKEMRLLRKMTFAEPVMMSLDIDIFTIENSSNDAQMLNKLHLHTDGGVGNEHFYIQMPKYVVFRDDAPVGEGNKLWIDDVIEHDFDKGHKHFTMDVYVEALDFSSYEGGGIKVENGRIEDKTTLAVRGTIFSDPLTFAANIIPELHDLHVKPIISFEPFVIKSVEGLFDPEIDVVNEVIDIDLGEDMDFIYDATLNFKNPQIYITLNNDGVTLPINANIALSGKDEHNNEILGSNVNFNLSVVPDSENKYYITPSGSSIAGYTSVAADLNNILTEIPHEIELTLEADVDNSTYNKVILGEDMEVSGSYELDIPMEFNEVDLEYTETIEDVLGDDPSEITDYITEITSITLEMEVENTVPAEFTPSIVAKTVNGTVLENINVVFDNNIAAGEGIVNGVVGAPVTSTVKVKLSATNNELAKLNTLDVVFHGVGEGVLNSNEYIKLSKMSITIDDPIIVDMN
ncbi:MAG: hypothetical protein IKJ31_06650 [Bacteroidaceae bacterium]|nr:hypothetical protein [Bacteroidaceae bacterium]